jgi:hypothetical protein
MDREAFQNQSFKKLVGRHQVEITMNFNLVGDGKLICMACGGTVRGMKCTYCVASQEQIDDINMVKQKGTHGCRNVTISALAYLINYLDCQRSGRVMGGPTFFKVGDLFYKICPSHYANFRKKISSETSCGMSESLGIT